MSIEVTVEYAHREWNYYDNVVHIRNYQQLQSKVAELEAENAKLHEQVDLQVPKMAFTQLKEQLAAEQLNNKLLREHLRKLIEFELLDAGALSTDELCAEFRQAVIAYNATQASTEALDKYVAEKVKEASNKVSGNSGELDEAVNIVWDVLAFGKITQQVTSHVLWDAWRVKQWLVNNKGYSDNIEVHLSLPKNQDLATLREEMSRARCTAEYWKAEHIAGNTLITALTRQRDLAVEWLERCAVHVRPTATIFYEEIMEALSALASTEALDAYVAEKVKELSEGAKRRT